MANKTQTIKTVVKKDDYLKISAHAKLHGKKIYEVIQDAMSEYLKRHYEEPVLSYPFDIAAVREQAILNGGNPPYTPSDCIRFMNENNYPVTTDDNMLFLRFKNAFPDATKDEFIAYQLYRQAHPQLNVWIPSYTTPTPENPTGQTHTPNK